MKKALIGKIITTATPNQAANAEIPSNPGIKAAMVPKKINISMPMMKARIVCINDDIRVNGAN